MKINKKTMKWYERKMKPCPCCGSRAFLYVGEFLDGTQEKLADDEMVFFAQCPVCFAERMPVVAPTPAPCVKAWNRWQPKKHAFRTQTRQR